MGFVTLGIFVNLYADDLGNLAGMDGAMMVMLAHGFNTGALFLLVGVVYERAHTRLISAFSGLSTRMPIYSAYFALFMLASIGLPGLSGFVGEFLVALATWRYNPWAAVFTFTVVILAAWYMMWLFQRIAWGRAPGELPDPHDGELTDEERAELQQASPAGHHQTGHGPAAPRPVTGGSHAHAADAHAEVWPDLTTKETLTLLPLAILTIVTGVYPGPIFDIAEPAFERILLPFV